MINARYDPEKKLLEIDTNGNKTLIFEYVYLGVRMKRNGYPTWEDVDGLVEDSYRYQDLK